MGSATIEPRELFDKYQQGEPVELIDVRTPVEFRELRATIARNVPLDRLNPQQIIDGCNGNGEKTLYVICQAGSRGAKAREKLVAAGYQNVVNVAGGTSAWNAEGLPVVRGKKAMSLERQVRIVAGLLVLLGSVLGFFVHPYWIGLSAFVGAGLAFAGITNTCAMGMLIARMPWNQVKGNETCSV